MSEFPHLKKMKIFQRQLTGEALKSNSIAKRIRISADPSIIYCPSPSGLAKKSKGKLEEVASNNHCKECTCFVFMTDHGVNFAEPTLVVL